jgi:hypothetical protein
MDQYIKDLTYVIQNGEMENTYKMVWIRSIVETCVLETSNKMIHFDKLSQEIFRYYWNQTIYFDLEQSLNPEKRPEIYQILLKEVNCFRSQYGHQPQWFNRIENKVNVPLTKISSILTKDVCWRFPKVDRKTYDLYDLDKSNHGLTFYGNFYWFPERRIQSLFDQKPYRLEGIICGYSESAL